ncbi:DUF1835 domain-containing protein [Cytobacillus purgationiresistens]|uniref:DUF1835 domain-containing protein n=1 Tax=Cytobacillus purgationiresistens TaxID=863449 RepID=A0ABU0AG17_9BACI|nr:DUF1835 domain-containing protein [Cytobacillus purgationiresistens]MDQ0269737.1 hypothetical protein [Cytobacillus purgationiresistens]
MEPNIVIVYHLNEDHYVTNGECLEGNEVFHLKEGMNFFDFNHLDNDPETERGYFFEDSTIHEMINEINQEVKKRGSYIANLSSSIHLVPSDQDSGSIKVGLRRVNALSLPDFLMVGPIENLVEKSGQNVRSEWLFDHINDFREKVEYESQFSQFLLYIDDIPKQIPIYIWFADNTHDQVFLRFIIKLLGDKKNNIYLINTTESWSSISNQISVNRINNLNPENLRQIFEANKNSKLLTIEQRKNYEQEWKVISEQGDMLRAWKDKQLHTLPEDYFDMHIIEKINEMHHRQKDKDFIQVGMIIYELLEGIEMNPGADFMEYRIRNLVYMGLLGIKGIPKSMHHYKVKMPS